MDIIKIDDLEVYAYHGVLEEEKRQGQFFYVSLRLGVDFKEAAERDDIEKTVNYSEVCDFAAEFMANNTFDLIETAADGLAEEILCCFKGVKEIYVEVKKPSAPVAHKFGCISVGTGRKWHRVFLGIGSNMGNKQANLELGIKALKTNECIRIKKVSSFIETEPYGYTQQDVFLNGAIEIETILEPKELLRLVKEIEKDAGRTETVHWGPRALDLDILFFDDIVMDEEDLTIPHREILLRDFVKIPLKEIAPDFVHPLCGKRICEL